MVPALAPFCGDDGEQVSPFPSIFAPESPSRDYSPCPGNGRVISVSSSVLPHRVRGQGAAAGGRKAQARSTPRSMAEVGGVEWIY